MSYRIPLSKVKPIVGPLVNACADDEQVTGIVNRSCERLLYGDSRSGSGKWQGCYGKYRVCVADSCLTWPREIETVEAWALDHRPIEVRNEWYEFLQMGPGLMNGTNRNGWQLIDDGESCVFDQPIGGSDKKLAVFCDVDEDAGATIIIRFYNSDGQKVRSENPNGSGIWIEGEKIVLPAAGNYTFTDKAPLRGGVYAVIKPRTKGVVRLYEFDTVASTYRPLGYYEPSEEVPVYRQSRIPGMAQLASGSGCKKHSVTITGKFRFIPAQDDNDLLQIPHLDAIVRGAQAVHYEDSHLAADAAQYWGLAFSCLHAQLAHYLGSGASVPIRMVGAETWGAGGIPHLR